ncbi:hypothetical protein E4U39_003677 [Claviceps sp. Clav50 group G5]|nr:hypothetical protein E4U39_003677 [Claviceps sp. Clav50 group G5]
MDDRRTDQKLLFPTVLDRFEMIGPNAPSIVHERGFAHGGELFCKFPELSRNSQLRLARVLDLHLGNLFLQLPSSFDNLSVEQLYARYGEPDKDPVACLVPEATLTRPSVPSYAVPSVWLGIPSDDLKIGEANLVLSDFGVAFRSDEKSQFVLHALAVLLPRDSQFQSEAPLTFPSDTWSLGCVIIELLGHRTLFDGYDMINENYITAQQIGLQWPMPPAWWSRWEARSKYVNEEDKGTKMADGYENWP